MGRRCPRVAGAFAVLVIASTSLAVAAAPASPESITTDGVDAPSPPSTPRADPRSDAGDALPAAAAPPGPRVEVVAAEREFLSWRRTESGVPERPLRGRQISVHTYGGVGFGRGVRLNNPFRLARSLGDAGESLSLTAPFLDLMLGVAAGPAASLQHGAVVHVSVAVDGVPQQVLSAGYGALLRLSPRGLALARVSLPVVLSPEVTAGGEAALGVVGLVRAGLGVSLELSGSVFEGAGTWDRGMTRIPIVGLELGAWFDWEALP